MVVINDVVQSIGGWWYLLGEYGTDIAINSELILLT